MITHRLCAAPMAWNGGAGSLEPNGLGDGAHGLTESVPFPANLVGASLKSVRLFIHYRCVLLLIRKNKNFKTLF